MNLGEADLVWFEQQKQAIKSDEQMRVVALNNDRDQYGVVLQKKAEDMIVDRHEANGQLFNAFFEKPGFRDALIKYLAESYDEIRDEERRLTALARVNRLLGAEARHVPQSDRQPTCVCACRVPGGVPATPEFS